MKMTLFFAIGFVLLISFGLIVTANAELIDRGGGLIYDTDLDITWLQDANYAKASTDDVDGLMSWSRATNWTNSLVYYDTARNVYWNDWRLPRVQEYDPTCDSQWSSNGNNYSHGMNCTMSDLGHLYYVELGNASVYNMRLGDEITTDPGVFKNVTENRLLSNNNNSFWTETPYSLINSERWIFMFNVGNQVTSDKDVEMKVWAVRDGDVGAPPVVPEPMSSTLFIAGGTLLAGRKYLKNKKKA